MVDGAAVSPAHQAVLMRLLGGQLTVHDVVAQTGLSRRELVAWRRAYLRQRVPARSGVVRAPVGGPTVVRWDRWGVPHIRAERTRDVFVALGHCMAQERLWQLDYMRRFAAGELATVLGPSALASDRMMRTLDMRRAAEASLPALDEQEAEALTAIADGINAWAEQCPTWPLEFELLDYRPPPWRPLDSILLWKYRWWTLTGRLDAAAVVAAAERYLPPDLRGQFLATELADETIVPADVASEASGAFAAGYDSGIGSNNWALAGARTTTGAPVLCSDPHNMLANPPQWLEAHLVGPDLDAIGAIYLGMPTIYLGRNRHVAWGVTNHAVSVRDVYAEEVDPADPSRYRDGDGWTAFDVEDHTIAVAGAPTERFTVRRSRRGPIVTDLVPPIDEAGWPPLSLRWVGHEPPSGVRAGLDLQRAGDGDAVRAALRRWTCPPLNVVYATTAGHIGYHVVGQVPRRAVATRSVRPANDSAHTWEGVLPFEALPALTDPQRGWVATANNPPWPAIDRHAPYLALGAWADGYRQRRIRRRIDAWPRLAPLEVGAIHGDVVHQRAVDLAGRMVELLEADKDGAMAPVAAVLRRWDGAYTTASMAPTLFQAIWETWRDHVVAARFPSLVAEQPAARAQASAIARRLLEPDPPAWFPDGSLDCAAQFRSVARRAIDALAHRLGPLVLPDADPALVVLGHPAVFGRPWAWGRQHRVMFAHPLGDRPGLRRLNVGPFGTSGGWGTVRAAGHEAGLDFTVTSGSTYRLLADLSGARAWATVTTGQSGHLASPHYRDQAVLWRDNRYHPLSMDDRDILANLEGELWLTADGQPKPGPTPPLAASPG
jgi:penicillin amidase